jgi:hypothetical protein
MTTRFSFPSEGQFQTTWTVFSLRDPETKAIRYIGTASDPRIAAELHIRNSHNQAVRHWADELATRGLKPLLVVIVTLTWDSYGPLNVINPAHIVAKAAIRDVAIRNKREGLPALLNVSGNPLSDHKKRKCIAG